MSKGEIEKVQLSLALSRNACLYILDEPLGGIDPIARDEIIKSILTNYSSKASIIISTHLINEIESIFDDVMFINNKNIVLSGSAEKIREQYGKSIDKVYREVLINVQYS